MTTLTGLRVVATSPGPHLAEVLSERGADVIALPVITFEKPSSWDTVDDAITKLSEGHYEWIVFASAVGVRFFLERVDEIASSIIDVFGSVRVAAVGGKTVEAITAADIDVDLVPAKFTGADAATALGSGTGRVLLPRPEVADEALLDGLRTFGWEPDAVVTYRTVGNEPEAGAKERVTERDFDVVAFTSGSTVRYFTELVAPPGELGLDESGDKRVVCIGPSTEAVAKSLGYRVDEVADPHTSEGVAQAIERLVGR